MFIIVETGHMIDYYFQTNTDNFNIVCCHSFMYLQKKIRNRYTVGKQLRKNKGLRKKDPLAQILAPSPQLQEYKQDLLNKGMKISHLELGLFQTKNGLRYPGFIATQTIVANTILLRVPVECLLTTRNAFLSQIQQVFEENPKFFAKAFSSDWQDRILLTYLLFEYQKGKQSRWYHLLVNLPRDIDYVIFWEDKELSIIQDQWVVRHIKKQRSRVSKQQQELIAIVSKYPHFFDMKTFTSQNIKWIHTHLVTRCFGKYFQYTTMVPYAQLFNHECIDVYYTMAYNPNNPHKTADELDAPREITAEQEQQCDTSDGSYEASDVSAEDEEYQQIDLEEGSKGIQWPQIQSIHSYITAFINFNDRVSLPYLQKIYEQMEEVKLTEILKETAAKRLEKVHSTNVKYLKLVKQFYYKLGSKVYSYGLKQKKKFKQSQAKNHEQQVDPNQRYFQGSWKQDKFDEFLMTCSSKDQFQAGSQVYFCYGRLPNRLLLIRYGISLEHNKYNHVFIRVNIANLLHQSKPLCRAVQADIALKKYRKFKIRRTDFCTQLLTFYRAHLWNYGSDPQQIFYITNIQTELKVLNLTYQVITTRLMSFEQTLKVNESSLLDKNFSYHQYFALVYKVEEQRILTEQLSMIQYTKQILCEIQNGKTLQIILKGQESEQKLRWQIMMQIYLKYFKLET